MSEFILFLYFAVLIIPSIFGLHRYWLVFRYYRTKSKAPSAPDFKTLKTIPFVTIQLPLYNERYVAQRIIESACRFDYPRDRFEIQVLDDSTDETVSIVERQVKHFQELGFQIEQVRRADRVNFKAGALEEGLKKAKGEFVAVFDADFLPQSDFLQKTIPHFYEHPKIGMVQARWGHLNRDYSLLTQAQSLLLDGHFVIEHSVRNRSGCFFNFNGTAGIWRKACIEETGGWSGDTLTEDIDLSYRAQMAGWQFIYLEDLVVPAELPVDINGLKSQQHRWAKGSIQVARKLLPALIKGPYPLRVKCEAIFHLAANINYLLIAILAFLMPLAVYVRYQEGWLSLWWLDVPLFMSATFSISYFYYHSQKSITSDFFSRIKCIPVSLAIGIGLAINNSKAVIEGFMADRGEFTRTPKYAIVDRSDSWKGKKYCGKWNLVSLIELALTVHLTAAVFYCLKEGLYFSLPFLLLFQVGFFYTSTLSILQGIYSFGLSPEASQIPSELPQIS